MHGRPPADSATAPRRGGSARLAWLFLIVILAFAAPYSWWPLSGNQRWGLYCLLEAVAIALTWVFTLRYRPPASWYWLLAGFTCNAIADLLYYRETVFIGMGPQAAFSDVMYMAAYVPLAVGLVTMGRRVGRTNGALLDASIFAIGLAVPVVAFYIVPTARETSIGLDGMLLVGWYALGSIFIFALYIHQITTRRTRNPAFLILGAAMLMTAIGDPLWNVHMMGGDKQLGDLPKLLWYLNRSLPLAVIVHPSVWRLWEYETSAADTPLPRLRLVALTLGSLMPALTLLLAQLAPPNFPYWIAVVGGGLLLPVLVLVRMDGLLQQLRRQARQLDKQSHYDELTGAPNRRHWKRALAAAASQARRDGNLLTLALMDLDHFKAFNDTHGHHAGDDLLCEAYAAWSARLPADCLIARYGGEEFTLLMPHTTTQQALHLLERMQMATPRGETFSAGVALCDPHADLNNALDAADAALYEAKQAGRRRIHIGGMSGSSTAESLKTTAATPASR
jgi:diguanylate cyclase (GGDEF)-like protein